MKLFSGQANLTYLPDAYSSSSEELKYHFQFFQTLKILFKLLLLNLSLYTIKIQISILSLDCKPSSTGTLFYSSFLSLPPNTRCVDYNVYSTSFKLNMIDSMQFNNYHKNGQRKELKHSFYL